ncbi:hypothetical protein MXB_1444 [Myxobolus squamalis]|nr:hypothetical protein MXB_1444 [Myxobolus squamalis]
MEQPNEYELSRKSENGRNFSNKESNIDVDMDQFKTDNSDDSESYNPSRGQFLTESTDISIDLTDGNSNASSNELEFLLKEMSMPIEELVPEYPTDFTNHKRKSVLIGPNHQVNVPDHPTFDTLLPLEQFGMF